MGLKPDHWIRRMAKEHAMIEPFEEKLVRQGVISYGLSSYGYDIRVADEFKIFTPNPYNTVVDPKALDERSLIPFKGDVCIIPPNSFALAVTVEYFRIPRNVLTVCLGKSTYARCFSGDTRVALVDGTAPTLEEMARLSEAGDLFWGYSIDTLGRVIVSLFESPRYIGRDSLIEGTLDNNATIQCTPDHRFLTRDGRMVEANVLRPGDSLMPLYRQLAQGYEMIYMPVNGEFYPTHCLADEWNLRHQDTPFRLIAKGENAGRAHKIPPVLTNEGCYPDQAGYKRNHKVQSIRDLPGDHDVYCLTVPEAGNFALEAGVFVHNCGLITNVTPFEPGWEGYVTLEISNTTPLPAKIYAYEGIAQVLFFEADEPCEVSYAERQGKYNKQTGITLPKV